MRLCIIDGCGKKYHAKGFCVSCYDKQDENRLRGLERKRLRRLANLDSQRAKDREKDKIRRSKPERKEYSKNYWKNYCQTEQGQSHRQKTLERYRKNRASRILLATPPWADLAAIQKVFDECPKGMVVDHVLPLSNKNICGLHIPINFQYLTPEENFKKGNRF